MMIKNTWDILKEYLIEIDIKEEYIVEGTVSGYPAIFLCNNGYSTQFLGYTEADYMSGYAKKRDDWLKKMFS